jgi:hypothetical protein
MNTYTCTGFIGHWPVGTAAVVIANDPQDAAMKLNAALKLNGLPSSALPIDMRPFPADPADDVRILCDGNY